MSKQSRERREKWDKVNESRETERLWKQAGLAAKILTGEPMLTPKHATSKGMVWGGGIVIDIQNVATACHEKWEQWEYKPFQSWGFERVASPFQDILFDLGEGDIVDENGCGHYRGRCVILCAFDRDDSAQGFELSIIVEDVNERIYELQTVSIFPDEEGKVLGDPFGEFYHNFRSETAWTVYPVLFALKLLSCHNVELVDREALAVDYALYQRKFGTPMSKYKVLTIRQSGVRHEEVNAPQQQFDIMPLHIRRGNFAHYSDDAPLFGKYTGTFWRSATVVGNEKNGIVAKDYKVNP